MLVLCTRAKLKCSHVGGRADASAHQQSWVRIQGAPILVEQDTASRSISGCPLVSPTKPCGSTMTATSGHSSFVRIGGARLQLEPTLGISDSVPPGVYSVADCGQTFVESRG